MASCQAVGTMHGVCILYDCDSTRTTSDFYFLLRVSCVVLILIWVRLFKYARGFRSLGPLVAIVNQLIGDILRYFTLYCAFFVPYVLSVWVLFGGQQSANLPDNDKEDLTAFYRVVTMMFRMGLIDEYPYSVSVATMRMCRH